MSLKQEEDSPSITVLKSHDLLHIFGYLDYAALLQCRLVCPFWYHIIKHESSLMDRFRFGLTFDSGTAVTYDEPPFSIVEETKIKIKRITLKDDFLEPGNSISTVEANKLKLTELSNILTDRNAANTVQEMIVHARDDQPRSNAMLFQFIMEMKNVRVLRFTLTAFVHGLDAICSTPESIEQRGSVEHVEIIHKDCKRLILADFEHLLQIFPNINRIDIRTSEAMLLGEDIIHRFAHLIKSIEKLESYTSEELTEVDNLSLDHFSIECCADNSIEVEQLHEFVAAHPKFETAHLKLLKCSGAFFNKPYHQLIGLDLVMKKFISYLGDNPAVNIANILQWTPNLKKLSITFKGRHDFGHGVDIQMKNLIDVTLKKFGLDCRTCFTTIMKSIRNVKSLKLGCRREITVRQLIIISQNLRHLESLELMFDDTVEIQNNFHRWPTMPNLKSLVVNRVGFLTETSISNLQRSSPKLEVIKLYSVRGANIPQLLKLLFISFPNLESLTFRGGLCSNIPELDYITVGVGWRLKELDISASIQHSDIMRLFKENYFLETVRCKYGAVEVTRRIYHEVVNLKAYTLESIETPMKNRQRLHMYDDMSSDSETSDSEESNAYSTDDEEPLDVEDSY